MITLDTSAILALLIVDDAHHERSVRVIARERQPFLVPEGILAEVCFMLEREYGVPGLNGFLEDVLAGGFALVSSRPDTERVMRLVARYANLPLGYADAAVIACAERHGGRILAFDDHFEIVSGEGGITVLRDCPI